MIIVMVIWLTGDRYDDEPRPSTKSRGRLDDIDDWETGNKSIAQEAIGKVKDFISKARGFDEPPDYG